MLKGMEEATRDWGLGGGFVWIWMAFTYHMFVRTLEIFAEDDSRLHAV